jgi:fatty-acyl-CoA synthase
MAGATLVPLPYHLRIRDAEAFAEATACLVGAARCRLVLADPRLLPHVPSGLGLAWDAELPARSTATPDRPTDADAEAAIQFTSGSTAHPKGVVLTHRAVLAGVSNSSAAGGLLGSDCRQLSWLPFFHDWGLFGHLVWSVVLGTEVHFLPTERFAKDPSEWLRLVGEVGATATPGPTTAWDAALRVAARRSDGIDLSSLRRCTLAAEAIDPAVADRMKEQGSRLGLAAGSIHAAYGMAETTLGISTGPLGHPIGFEAVDREQLATEDRARPSEDPGARRIASCGFPVPNTEVRIASPDGSALEDRTIGEILVRGPSVMSGYLDDEGESPFLDGWLRTGDLGYLAGGEVFVTGRLKDIVIVMGRNYSPQDIEWAAERVSGVRAGRCVAFGSDDGEGAVVVAVEPSGDATDLGRTVWETVADGVGIAPREVLVLPRGTIPLTTSGKLRRGWVRDAYQRGELHAIAATDAPTPDLGRASA